MQLPGEVRHGARRGQRIWLPPSLGRVLGFIKNPRYAGAFAWGRRDDAPVAGAQGPRALENRWQVLLPNFHAGYINWERFVANQTILARNEGAFSHRLPTPRQGVRAAAIARAVRPLRRSHAGALRPLPQQGRLARENVSLLRLSDQAFPEQLQNLPVAECKAR